MPKPRKRYNRSIAMEEDLQDFLQQRAKEHNTSVSKILRDLVETYLLPGKKITVIEHDGNFIPIVLKIPKELVGDAEELATWINFRTKGVIERLSNAPKN